MNENVSELGLYDKPYKFQEDFALRPAFPNPFNNTVQINFTINNPGYVSIGICNIKGRWISTLVGEYISQGTHSLSWDGIDMNGNQAASGLYLVVMKYAGSIKTKKINLIK